MSGFEAVILVCQKSIAADQCDEHTAVEVRSVHVASELGCFSGWQEVIARAVQDGDTAETYTRTICRRSRR